MILNETFPRATVFWILIAQIVVYLPHVSEMPIWVTGLYIAALVWRFGIYQGRWPYPNNWVKVFLIVAAFLSVLVSFQSISGSRGGVALLLIAFAFKSLEMKTQRDAYLVVMLAYFVVACGFLYQRSFLSASYLFACLVIVSAALVSMNHLPKKTLDIQGLWLSTKMLLQSIPIMIFLFVFFPQMPPLFQMNLGGKEAKTGLSETMNPGSVAELTQSSELAFRAKFEGELPDKNKLYWRAQVFERFDGIGWKMSDKKESELTRDDVFPAEMQKNDTQSESIRYEIYQEASDRKMLFSLATAWSDEHEIQLNTDYSLSRSKKIDKLYRYTLESNLALKRDVQLSSLSRQLNTSVPLYGNEKSKSFAQQLRRQVNSEEEYIDRVLKNFLNQEFEYTLKPDVLGGNPIDEFLFQTRRGFCEHFASSFVYLVRAAGIPARVVAGYHGGEYNANGEYLLVHQYEAHAWAEVWLENRGWVRVDPTAWVAPERINQGLDQALPEGEGVFDGNLLAARRFNALTELRLQLDYLNMQWDKWVLGYDEEMQAKVWRNILGEVTAARVAVFMAICFAFVVLMTAFSIYLNDILRVKDPVDRLYLKMQSRLRRRKLRRNTSETPMEFVERVKTEDEELGKKLEQFTQYYMRLKFQKDPAERERNFQIRKMKQSLRSI